MKIFNLVVGRVLERVHDSLNQEEMESMENIFLSVDDKEKERFMKKNIPNFKELFKEETKKVNKELAEEMVKQASVAQ